MLEIKVQCDCGQKYKFDVEPVNGRIPFAVRCPLCGLDGTDKGNAILRQVLSASAAPAPVPSAAAIAPPPSRLRVSSAAPAAAAPAVAEPPPPVPAPARRTVPRVFSPALPEAEQPKAQPRLVLGILGAVIGGFIGMMLWFWLIKLTGWTIGYAAWGVGAIAGVGTRILGREESPVLGAVAATCTAVAILGGQYLFAADFVKSKLGPLAEMMEGAQGAMQEAASEAYQEKLKYGQEALKVQSDDDARALYEKINGMKPDSEELDEFKKTELPELKDIGSGKLTKEQYLQKTKAEIKKLGFTVRWELFKATVDVYTIIFLLLGIVTAFKIGAG